MFDITKRKQAEEAIIENESRLKALVSTLDDIVFEFDGKGTYLNIWVENEKLLAKPKDQMLGNTIFDILGYESAEPFLRKIQQVMLTGESDYYDYFFDLIDGRQWFSARLNPIYSVNGNINSVSFIARNITDRKLSEDALTESERKFKDLANLLPKSFLKQMRMVF